MMHFPGLFGCLARTWASLLNIEEAKNRGLEQAKRAITVGNLQTLKYIHVQCHVLVHRLRHQVCDQSRKNDGMHITHAHYSLYLYPQVSDSFQVKAGKFQELPLLCF